MMYLGDFTTSQTVHATFSTNDGSGGRVAFSNALETADLRIYKNGSITQRSSMAGVTVTSAFDSLVGIHHVAVDLSDDTDSGFYATGEYSLVLYPDETVDSQSVAAVLAQWSIGRQPAVNTVAVNGTNPGGPGGLKTFNDSQRNRILWQLGIEGGSATQPDNSVKVGLFSQPITEAYAGAADQTPTMAEMNYMILQYLIERSISSTTETIKKRDQSTTAFSLTLNDSSNPTSVTQAT